MIVHTELVWNNLTKGPCAYFASIRYVVLLNNSLAGILKGGLWLEVGVKCLQTLRICAEMVNES